MGARLDDFAKVVGSRVSRRSVVALVAGGILGGSTVVDAGAARKNRKQRRGKARRASKGAETCPVLRQCGPTCCNDGENCCDASIGQCLRPGEMCG